MNNYFKISYKARDSAEAIAKKIGGYAAKSSMLCPHGRCICYLVFSKDNSKAGTFIACHKCYEINK